MEVFKNITVGNGGMLQTNKNIGTGSRIISFYLFSNTFEIGYCQRM